MLWYLCFAVFSWPLPFVPCCFVSPPFHCHSSSSRSGIWVRSIPGSLLPQSEMARAMGVHSFGCNLCKEHA